MNSRRLGKTDYQLSEIGVGCWQFGGDFGPIDDKISQTILDEARRQNVTFFDTADVYGAGRSERVIGDAFGANADIKIATKVGRTAALYPDGYEAKAIERHIQDSLNRLQQDRLDLVQLHCVPTDVLKEGAIFDMMRRLKDACLIHHWGASVETLEEAHLCLDEPDCASLQIIFNLYRQDAIWELFERAQQQDVGIIVRLPLASGILTGKFGAAHQFDQTDHRHFNRDGAFFSVGETFSGIEQAKAVALLEEIKPFVPEEWSLADFALRWILDHEAVTSVIAGCSRPEQIVRNVKASTLPPVSKAVHDDLRRLYLDEIRPHIRCPL